jgi:hypothetical protein
MGKIQKLIFSLLMILSFQSFGMDTIIISDLDDTIKRTNVSSTVRAGVNALWTRKVFSGMTDLFRTMEPETSGLYVLSNSINLFRHNIRGLINKHNINALDVSTRSLFKDKDKFKYKYEYIVNKITSLNVKVILMGDDVGEDPEVYAKVLADYPNNVAGIYIHRSNKRDIPEVATAYHSFLDIALYEYEAGRLNLSQVSALSEKFMSIEKMKNLFPKFKHCPTNFWRNIGEGEIATIVENMTNKVIKFCKNR